MRSGGLGDKTKAVLESIVTRLTITLDTQIQQTTTQSTKVFVILRICPVTFFREIIYSVFQTEMFCTPVGRQMMDTNWTDRIPNIIASLFLSTSCHTFSDASWIWSEWRTKARAWRMLHSWPWLGQFPCNGVCNGGNERVIRTWCRTTGSIPVLDWLK